MVEIGGIVSDLLPSWSSINPLTLISWLVFSIIFLILVGFVTYMIVMRFVYRNRIHIYRDINGRPELVDQDWAMEKKLSNGTTCFRLRKYKKEIPTGFKQMGRRIYWYYIRPDDYWDNVGPIELASYYNKDNQKILETYVPKGLQYSHTQLGHNFDKRYNKINWIDKYLGIIVYTTLIIFTGLMIWLLFREWVGLTSTVTQTVEVANQILEKNAQLLNAMDNVCSRGGSGYIQLS